MRLAGLKLDRLEAESAGVDGSSENGAIIITDTDERMKVLRHFWSNTFAYAGEMLEEEAEEFVRDYCSEQIWDWSECRPPSWETFTAFLLLLSNSAPGLDGIPNAAWKALCECKALVAHFWALLQAFLSNGALPSSFNHGLFVFIPKIAGPIVEAIYCHPSELRPLTLKLSLIHI